jgi:hypothetical protein
MLVLLVLEEEEPLFDFLEIGNLPSILQKSDTSIQVQLK